MRLCTALRFRFHVIRQNVHKMSYSMSVWSYLKIVFTPEAEKLSIHRRNVVWCELSVKRGSGGGWGHFTYIFEKKNVWPSFCWWYFDPCFLREIFKREMLKNVRKRGGNWNSEKYGFQHSRTSSFRPFAQAWRNERPLTVGQRERRPWERGWVSSFSWWKVAQTQAKHTHCL